jgi:hypothetical protein
MSNNLGPLGVVIQSLPNEKARRDELLNKLAVLEGLDFLPYIERIHLEDYKLPKTSDLLAVREAKRFLALPLLVPEPEHKFVPATIVDEVWHSFILDTEVYMAACNQIYGRYLHHKPRSNRAETVAESIGLPYRYTKDLLDHMFGAVVPQIWGPIAAGCDTDAGECVIH